MTPMCPICSPWTLIWDHFMKKIMMLYKINRRSSWSLEFVNLRAFLRAVGEAHRYAWISLSISLIKLSMPGLAPGRPTPSGRAGLGRPAPAAWYRWAYSSLPICLLDLSLSPSKHASKWPWIRSALKLPISEYTHHTKIAAVNITYFENPFLLQHSITITAMTEVYNIKV